MTLYLVHGRILLRGRRGGKLLAELSSWAGLVDWVEVGWEYGVRFILVTTKVAMLHFFAVSREKVVEDGR